MSHAEHRHATLEEFLDVVRRYRIVIIVSTLLVPAAAFLLALQQEKVYRATADVLLEQQDLGGAITGIPTANTDIEPERNARTQAALAGVEPVAARALEIAGVTDITPAELLESSEVSPRPEADILRFRVDSTDEDLAVRLANAYATAFTSYKLERDTRSLQDARAELEKRLADLRDEELTGSQLYADLVKSVQDLRTLELLQARASVVQPATASEQVQPRPIRTAALGAALGLLLGLGIAFLLNALDQSIRSEEEIESRLGLPLLARAPKYAGRSSHALVMLDAPSHAAAESIRRLRTNIELAAITSEIKTIMVTSAAPTEGKSTTLANLAVALARAGHSVALVDLDLRQPSVSTLFSIPSVPGIVEVTQRSASLRAALQTIALPDRGTLRGTGTPTGTLDVVASGSPPSDPGELVTSPTLVEVISQLRSSHDFVLIDAPPLLAVGDAISLSTMVDAIFVVVRMSITKRPMLKDLDRTLGACPAVKLGFVLTDVGDRERYGGAYHGYYASRDTPADSRSLREVSAGRP